jgi:hypothetical protein
MLTNILLLPLMAYAAVGPALSLVVHLLSYADLEYADLELGENSLFMASTSASFRCGFPWC